MRIALVLNDDFSAWRFRKGLIKVLLAKGVEVCVVSPGGPYVEKIVGLGATHRELPMYRFFSPVRDIGLFMSLYRLFRCERFDVVHNMTMKPVVYGSMAAKAAGVRKIVGLISGMGFMFSDKASVKMKSMMPFLYVLLRCAFYCCDKVWFQNPDDIDYMVDKKLLSREKAVLIKGSGVDLDEFSSQNVAEEAKKKVAMEFNIKDGDKVVTMVAARLIWPKGVAEFLKAGKILTEKYPFVKFIMVTPMESANPEAVPIDFVRSYLSPNISVVTDFREDTKEIMAISDVVVLPSYYREGVPRVLLEAMALGKPVVTADTPGCREAVEDGRNGFIVPPKEHVALSEAIEKCIVDGKRRKIFGEYSRGKVETEFAENNIVKKVLNEVYGFAA